MELVSVKEFKDLKADFEAFKNETMRRIQMLSNAIAKKDDQKKKEKPEKPKSKKK